VESVVEELQLKNVQVSATRAEEVLRNRRVEVITARAVAPISRAVDLFLPALKQGSKLILYKGPDSEAEIREAESELRNACVAARIVDRYELPQSMGARSIVELALLHR